MLYLLITSLLWAVSFGLLKGQLQGIDPVVLSSIRLGISLLVFLPLLRPSRIDNQTKVRLAAIGAVQFGLMYLLYLKAFAYLAAYEVALFTVFTPLYVVLLDALMERVWNWSFLWAAGLAAVGAGIVLDFHSMSAAQTHGFLLLQLSNVCFAAGQLLWRREHKKLQSDTKDAQVFAIPYLGAFATTLITSLFTSEWGALTMTGTQVACVIYLGAVASGLCFFLWNVGAEKVNAGLLAVMNNVKIPLAIAISLLCFGEKANIPRLLLGGAVIMAGVWLAKGPAKEAAKN